MKSSAGAGSWPTQGADPSSDSETNKIIKIRKTKHDGENQFCNLLYLTRKYQHFLYKFEKYLEFNKKTLYDMLGMLTSFKYIVVFPVFGMQ